VTNDDLLYRHRLLVFARAAEEGVSRACRALGYHRSWFYRWKGRVEREGLEVLRPRERRAPRMPNQIPPWQEKQILALALANPGLGPRRLAAQLAVEQTLTVSASGVLRVLRRHGLETRLRRLSLVSGYAAPPQPERPLPPVNRHLEARQPGDLVQLDCFHIGRLTGTKGRVWQYTAIDVASSFVWAQVHRTHLNPSAQFTTALARRVAKELSAAGWKLKAITTDNGSEFRSLDFREAVGALGVEQRSSVPADHKPMAPLSEFSEPSSRSAGDRPSPCLWCPSTRLCAGTWLPTCATTTFTAPTPANGAPVARRLNSSTVLGKCSLDEPLLSRHLGRCSS